MAFSKAAACAALACASLAACSVPAPATIAQGVVECAKGAQFIEVRDDGTIVRVLGTRESRSGAHEGFVIRVKGGTYVVEDNVDLTGPIPLQRGEGIALQGQLECNDRVIHWTHRDPRGRHVPGYITAGGRTYQ